MSKPDVISTTAATFVADVIEASQTQVVIVDFWATWCQPCLQLAPLLEQLAEKHAGRLRIVKVDSDAEAEVAQQFQIRSLPTLMLFHQGRPVDQVVGVQPLGQLQAWVEPYLGAPAGGVVEAAQAALEAGDVAGAIAALRDAIAANPEDIPARIALAEALVVAGEFDDAGALLTALPAVDAVTDNAQRVRSRLDLARAAAQAGDGDEQSLEGRYARALAGVAAGQHPAALDVLLGIVAENREWNDGAARKAMVDAFRVIDDAALVREYRTRLARVLN